MVKTLEVRLSGGLGNQLFQICGAWIISHHSGHNVKIDNHSGFFLDFKYKRKSILGSELESNNISLLVKKSFAFIRFKIIKSKSSYIRYIHSPNTFELKEIVKCALQIDNRCLVDSLMQDCMMCIQHENLLKSKFQAHLPFLISNQPKKFNKVGLHVRWFDGEDDFMDYKFKEYFNKIVSLSEFQGKEIHIVTNSKDRTSKFFKDNFQNVAYKIINNGSEQDDFLYLQEFDTIITTTSTFGWWSAFLSNASNIFIPNTINDISMNWGGGNFECLRRGLGVNVH